MENTHEVQAALIHFIQSKPEGNALRDIAIRTLKDLNTKYERAYYGTNELKDIRVNDYQEIKSAIEFQQIEKREIHTNTRKNLIKIRRQAGLSREHFARVINLSYAQLKHYEFGKAIVPIDLVVNVCGSFNISVDRFLTQSI
jgi:DNA-binding transcriptional regulator YiaG